MRSLTFPESLPGMAAKAFLSAAESGVLLIFLRF